MFFPDTHLFSLGEGVFTSACRGTSMSRCSCGPVCAVLLAAHSECWLKSRCQGSTLAAGPSTSKPCVLDAGPDVIVTFWPPSLKRRRFKPRSQRETLGPWVRASTRRAAIDDEVCRRVLAAACAFSHPPSASNLLARSLNTPFPATSDISASFSRHAAPSGACGCRPDVQYSI